MLFWTCQKRVAFFTFARGCICVQFWFFFACELALFDLSCYVSLAVIVIVVVAAALHRVGVLDATTMLPARVFVFINQVFEDTGHEYILADDSCQV
jgi:hypothetical protein